MNIRSFAFFTGLAGAVMPLLIAGAVVISVAVQADEGHGHGEAAPASVAGAVSPRVTAHSGLFEIVGVVDGGAMTIHLDRYDTNEPVTGARVEVEAGAAKGVAAAQADGTYRFAHEALTKPGTLPVSFTVTDKSDTDLLAGDLVLGEGDHGQHDEGAPAARRWPLWAAWAVAGLAALSLAAFAVRRRLRHGAAR